MERGDRGEYGFKAGPPMNRSEGERMGPKHHQRGSNSGPNGKRGHRGGFGRGPEQGEGPGPGIPPGPPPREPDSDWGEK